MLVFFLVKKNRHTHSIQTLLIKKKIGKIMLLQIRVSAVSLLLLVLIAQCLSNAHPQQGRAFAAGRWNFSSNGKVFIDTKNVPATTNKLKTRKLGMVEKGEDEGGAWRRSLSMQQRKEVPGFVAYTLDYHPPKHHPPKNN